MKILKKIIINNLVQHRVSILLKILFVLLQDNLRIVVKITFKLLKKDLIKQTFYRIVEANKILVVEMNKVLMNQVVELHMISVNSNIFKLNNKK